MNAPLCFIKEFIMSNINKILITIVSCVFMICIASVSIVSIVTSNKEETTTVTTTAVPVEDITDTTAAPVVTEPSHSTETTTPPPTTATTAAPVTSTQANTPAEVTGNVAIDILGSWKDSAGMSGYEFLEGGTFNWTYVDLEGFGVPFNGKTSGSYSIEGDTLTIKYSIYTATIKKTYRVSISQNELSMYDLEEHETSTYMRAS